MGSREVQPIFILPEGTTKTSGRTAQKLNIEAAKLVADQVRTTLGPKGMDKMIVDSLGDVTITNDGVTILQEMNIEHPAAKMIVEIAKTQEDEVGDGTTTAVVFAGELLKNAEGLLEQNVHPTMVTKGYRLASDKALEVLGKIAEKVTLKDTATLRNIAATALTGRGSESDKELLSSIVVSAVTSVAEESNGKVYVDTDNIKIEKKVGSAVADTELISGILLDKERVHSGMPRQVKNAKIALVDAAIEVKDTEIDAKISITDPSQLQAFLDQEEKMIRDKVEKVLASGANVMFCQKGVDDIAQYYFAQKGVYVARRVSKDDMEKLSRATGATLITSLKDLSPKDLGNAGLVEEVKVGDESMTFVRECKNPKSVTILVRGGTAHVADEIKRVMQDALGALAATLQTGMAVAGGGAVEMELSKQIKEYANSLSGKEQLAVIAFANSLEVIPRTLAESAGLDPIDKLAELKAHHDRGEKWAGLDVFTGQIRDSWKACVIEPLKTKTQAIKSASEVAIMILRIDDVIAGGNKPSGGQGMPPGMGGMGGMGM
ncbi:MAG: thermosome subunit beta [Nanoarchaeota archaeon]